MNSTHNDQTFFTNESGQTLLDRFKSTLKDTQFFDVLVGYFRSRGFYQLYESVESIEKTRILIGLGIQQNPRSRTPIRKSSNIWATSQPSPTP
jgi:hypothetical protein